MATTTDTSDTTDRGTTEAIDRWLDAYTEAEASVRRATIEALWNPQGALVEPPLDAHGHDAIDSLAVALQAQFAGATFTRTTALDEHHRTARYGWDMIGADGAVVLSGIDVVRFDEDGRLLELVGFFGSQPAPR